MLFQHGMYKLQGKSQTNLYPVKFIEIEREIIIEKGEI